MKTAALLLALLGLLALGHAAPLADCEPLSRQIQITKQEVLGKWHYIAGSSNIPGARLAGYLPQRVMLEMLETDQDNKLYILQTQQIIGQCSTWTYNMTFENSMMTVDEPFSVKEVFLATECSDCVVILEDVVTEGRTFTSLLLLSRSARVQPEVVETFKRQVKCHGLDSTTVVDPNHELCPHSDTRQDGLSLLDTYFKSQSALQITSAIESFLSYFSPRR